ncbi:putative transposase, IS605 OrfB family [Candidatus Nitrososphaera gargensis Ga9.2]|uniref:Putative transposase, IS605 OrfB family n=1 Tax=Nitrososphaera gargensis (strain Ga9.2) TaxID=1237085 RepID=K0IMM5_NITGG|nr:RNA-guided endonuclease TnpB family protein [Candidatus Nitrososphaera gargensis]AFU58024.1 putative transposase, IS605 OrfB family [Candidatus Nitrososphaera gargensis Ga9.2]
MLNYKFRLYPTKEQELVLEQTLDGCRWVYNYFFDKNMSKEDMQFTLVELKEQHPWLRKYYHSKMLQMVTHQVAAARKASKDKLLSYRKNEDFNAFTYNQSGFKIEEDGKLYLSKIGSIRIVLHRKPVNVKQVTICRKNSKWYAVAACQLLRRMYSTLIKYRKPVGIDVGITKFCHDSDNHVEDNPQLLTKMLRPLRKAHRRVSRRQTGSSNREKARHMLARLYERIHNKRRDFLHKLSAYYASRYDLIFLEGLKVANLTRNHRLARKILDASWSAFKNMLQYKANRVVEVEPAYSSVDCSRCGHPVPKSLVVRTHVCTKCRAVLDREYNATINILQRGLESLIMLLLLLPVERREVTPVEIQHESVKQEEEEAIGQVR